VDWSVVGQVLLISSSGSIVDSDGTLVVVVAGYSNSLEIVLMETIG
jgi:hypothetical protein